MQAVAEPKTTKAAQGQGALLMKLKAGSNVYKYQSSYWTNYNTYDSGAHVVPPSAPAPMAYIDMSVKYGNGTCADLSGKKYDPLWAFGKSKSSC